MTLSYTYRSKKLFLFLLYSIIFSFFNRCSATIEYTLELPVLGPALLTGSVDIIKSDFSFSGSLVGKEVAIDLGPLVLDKPTIQFSNAKGVGLNARGTLLDSSIEAGIKELTSKDRIVLGVTFLTKPTIYITQNQTITLDEVDVILERNKPVLIQTRVKLFSRDVILTIGGSKEKTYFSFELPLIKITDFDPSLHDSVFENVNFKNSSFSVEYAAAKEKEASSTAIELVGEVDFSSVGMVDVSMDVSNLSMNAYYKKDKGVIIHAQVKKDIELPYIGAIKNSSLIFFSKPHAMLPTLQEVQTKKISQWKENLPLKPDIEEIVEKVEKDKEKKYNFFIFGENDFTIPELGTLSVATHARFTRNQFHFEGRVKNEFNLGALTIKNSFISFSKDPTLAFSLEGTGNVEGLDINAQLTVAFQTQKKEDKTKKTTPSSSALSNLPVDISLKGTLKSAAGGYQPFKNVIIPGITGNDANILESLTLHNISVGFTQSPEKKVKRELFLEGEIDIWNNTLQAHVSFAQTKTGQKGATVRLGLPSGWKFSNISPTLQALDTIYLQNAFLYFSSFDHDEQTIMGGSKVKIAKGLSLSATVDLHKSIPNADKIVQGLAVVSVYGSFSTDGAFRVGAGLPTLLKFDSSKVRSVGVSFVIGNSPGSGSSVPYIALETTLVVKPTPKDDDLTFSAQIKPTVTELKISGTLQGTWDSPLGIHGLAVGDVALEADINYAQLAAGIPISGLGFAGNLQLGDERKKRNMALAFHLTENPNDLLLVGKYDRALSIFELIDICKDMAIRALEQTIKNSNELPAKKAQMQKDFDKIINFDIAKDLVGVYLHDISIRLIFSKNTQIGMLSFEEGLTLKGKLDVLGKTAAIDVNLNSTGLEAKGSLPTIDWSPLLKLTAGQQEQKKSGTETGPLINIALNLTKQHAGISGRLNFLGIDREIEFSLGKEGLYASFTQKLFNLFEATFLLKTQGSLQQPDLSLNAVLKQDLINFLNIQATKAINDGIMDAINKLREPLKKVRNLDNQVRDFDNQIQDRQKRIAELSKTPLDGFLHSGDIIKLGIEISGLEIAKGGVIAGKEIAQGTLKTSQDFLGSIGKVATGFTTLPEKILDIRSIDFETSVKNWLSGQLPHFKIEVVFFGKQHHLDMQLDLSSQPKAQKSAESIAMQLISLFQ